MRFEPQIDGTFDPSHYSDQSLDGIRSVPTTPNKASLVKTNLRNFLSLPLALNSKLVVELSKSCVINANPSIFYSFTHVNTSIR